MDLTRVTRMKILLSGLLIMAFTGAVAASPMPVPAPPMFDVHSYILEDFDTGRILAEYHPDQREPPASLTKLMSLYVTFHALHSGAIKLTDPVPVSAKAWRTGGSRMFIEVGTKVPVDDLIKGVVVDSGNDATVALAQYVAGGERAFVGLMNHYAKKLGMTNTHYANATGLPHPDHYSTARDLATLTRALIRDFPQYYHAFFKLGHFTYDHITQYNRNKLLWRDSSVDGVKTGYTEAAGYCLIASAQRGDMRLVSVVMGAPTEQARVSDSQALLDYGFHFYETRRLYNAGQTLSEARIWKGKSSKLPLGLEHALYVTVPRGDYKNLRATMNIDTRILAPAVKGHPYGTLNVSLDNQKIAQQPLVALQDVPQGSLWRRLADGIALWFHH